MTLNDQALKEAETALLQGLKNPDLTWGENVIDVIQAYLAALPAQVTEAMVERLDTQRVPKDHWGNRVFFHDHIQSLWSGWLASAKSRPELTTLRAENKRLRELVSELASDVESDVKAKYCDRDGAITHPSYVRKFNRDMSVVVEARSAIDEDNHSPITALKEQGE